MNKYTTLFFDLDGTLWDIKQNTQITLRELWKQWEMESQTIETFRKFYQRYTYHNDQVWALYRDNKIDKEMLRVVRFERALNDIGLVWSNEDVLRFAEQFIDRCPSQPHLLPGALELLKMCKPHFKVYMITNGFNEIQTIKMKAAGIDQFFESVIYSEDLGIKKPHPEIFQLAMQRAKCLASEALMIGDDWDADMVGAMGVNMDQAFLASTEDQLNEIRIADGLKPLRHNRQPTYRLGALVDLMPILQSNLQIT
jgi:putative hydrolase of the HAD superfamily